MEKREIARLFFLQIVFAYFMIMINGISPSVLSSIIDSFGALIGAVF